MFSTGRLQIKNYLWNFLQLRLEAWNVDHFKPMIRFSTKGVRGVRPNFVLKPPLSNLHTLIL